MKKGFPLLPLIAILALLLCLAGCADNSRSIKSDTKTIVDAAGREVVVPVDPQRIAAMSGPSYEMVFMLGGADRVAMTKSGHTTDFPLALMLYPRLAEINGIGANPSASVNIEDYLKNDVDLVIYYDNETELKKFAAANIPTVVISNGSITSGADTDPANFTVEGYVEDASVGVRALAELLGEEAMQRYEAWYQYNLDVADFLYERTKDLTDAQRPTVYWGNSWGENILSTVDLSNHFFDVMLAGGTFVAPVTSGGNFPEVTAEQLFTWDPDIIVVDNHGNYPELVIRSMQKENSQWASLKAVQNNELHRVPTGVFFIDRGTAHSLMLLWLATFVQPELFADVDIIHEIKYYYDTFYGSKLTDEQAEMVLNGWYEQK